MDIIQAINQKDLPILSSKPKRCSVFNNKKNLLEKLEEESTRANVGLVDLSSSLSQELLVQLLINGSPKAYIELFELTQIKEKKQEDTFEKEESVKPHLEAWKEILGDRQRMELMKDLLEVIEITSKSGQLDQLFHAQFQMGNIFDDVGDLEKSIFYYSSALSVAKQIGEPRYEAQVKLNLGKVYERMNIHIEAIKYFEDFFVMATSMDDIQGIRDVSLNLLEVYTKCAEEADKASNLHRSIEFYNKCVDLASMGGNARVVAQAKHKLGLLHYRLQHPLLALEYQTSYISYCNSANDNLGKTKGHAAVAQVFATLGNVEGEIHHLENLLDVSKLLDKKTEARAYCKLGMAYTQQGQLDYATTYFERYYKLACELKDVKMLAYAAINLGLTRCGSNNV